MSWWISSLHASTADSVLEYRARNLPQRNDTVDGGEHLGDDVVVGGVGHLESGFLRSTLLLVLGANTRRDEVVLAGPVLCHGLTCFRL